MLNAQSLKVDCTALPNDTNNRNQFLVVENVNIPEDKVYNPAEYTLVLERTRNFLAQEFRQVNVVIPVYFQVTATYKLVHRVTGAIRQWTGSFFPRGNSLLSLTPFTRFDPDTFVNFVQRQTSRELIEDKLKSIEIDSQWQFDSLVSVIVNSQANVSVGHPVLTLRGLIHHGRRRKRVHRTFELP